NGRYSTSRHPAFRKSSKLDIRGEKTLSYCGNVFKNQGTDWPGFHGSSVRKLARLTPNSPISRKAAPWTGAKPVVTSRSGRFSRHSRITCELISSRRLGRWPRSHQSSFF